MKGLDSKRNTKTLMGLNSKRNTKTMMGLNAESITMNLKKNDGYKGTTYYKGLKCR